MTGFGAIRIPSHRPSGGPAWNMAHRRDSARYRLRLLLSALLLTVLVGGGIQLGNAVTTLRRQVQDLARQNTNLEAQRAQLAVRWNTQTSRHVVLKRAEQELGLIVPEAPAAILVSSGEPIGQGEGWARWLRRLGPLDPVPMAQAAPGAP